MSAMSQKANLLQGDLSKFRRKKLRLLKSVRAATNTTKEREVQQKNYPKWFPRVVPNQDV